MNNVMRLSFFLLLALVGCSKSDFLNKKPNSNIVVPTSIEDMNQLLDNTVFIYSSPSLGIMSSDEYYYQTFDAYQAAYYKTEKNAYIWTKDIYQGENSVPDWNIPYQGIFYCNVILEQWEKLPEDDKKSLQGQFIKGWALFNRGYAYFNLMSTFSPAYNAATAATDLGVPLKLTANINNLEQRATVDKVYSQILLDLRSSIQLLPNSLPVNRNRPSKVAAYALLSRVSLNMRDYSTAGKFADSSLQLHNSLIDYNTLDATSNITLTNNNTELLYYNITHINYGATFTSYAASVVVDSNLIKLYDSSDLRKQIFFENRDGGFFTKAAYACDNYFPFTGLAVDEIYLIRAECLAREEKLSESLMLLNSLLITRYSKGGFKPFKFDNSEQLLKQILIERRKELAWRGARWNDLRRLNMEGANITLKRVLNGVAYTLLPRDPRYTMPIPDDEIALSHIQQNIR